VEGDTTQLTRDEPRHGMPGLGVRLTAQLKCIYTNARSMRNKQEELGAIVRQDRHDTTEMWWDDPHDWSAAMCMAINTLKGIGEDREAVG